MITVATCDEKEIKNDISLVFENTNNETDSIDVTGNQDSLELVVNNIVLTILQKRRARSKIKIICRFISFLENSHFGSRLTCQFIWRRYKAASPEIMQRMLISSD